MATIKYMKSNDKFGKDIQENKILSADGGNIIGFITIEQTAGVH